MGTPIITMKLSALVSIAVALVAAQPALSEEHLRGVVTGDHPMPSPALPRGNKGDETCGCYDITKHKCKCKDSVCSKNSCEKQDDEHFWTGGCSCGCPGKEVGKDCPEKPPHVEEGEDVDIAKRAAAAAVNQ